MGPMEKEIIKGGLQGLPGCPVVKNTSHFQCRGEGSILGYGTKIPHTVQHSQKQGEGSRWDKGHSPSSQNTGQRYSQPLLQPVF